MPFSVIRSRVFIKVCSFSKHFEIEPAFFRSCAESIIKDRITERRVQPMKEKNAGYPRSGINRKLRKNIEK